MLSIPSAQDLNSRQSVSHNFVATYLLRRIGLFSKGGKFSGTKFTCLLVMVARMNVGANARQALIHILTGWQEPPRLRYRWITKFLGAGSTPNVRSTSGFGGLKSGTPAQTCTVVPVDLDQSPASAGHPMPNIMERDWTTGMLIRRATSASPHGVQAVPNWSSPDYSRSWGCTHAPRRP